MRPQDDSGWNLFTNTVRISSPLTRLIYVRCISLPSALHGGSICWTQTRFYLEVTTFIKDLSPQMMLRWNQQINQKQQIEIEEWWVYRITFMFINVRSSNRTFKLFRDPCKTQSENYSFESSSLKSCWLLRHLHRRISLQRLKMWKAHRRKNILTQLVRIVMTSNNSPLSITSLKLL